MTKMAGFADAIRQGSSKLLTRMGLATLAGGMYVKARVAKTERETERRQRERQRERPTLSKPALEQAKPSCALTREPAHTWAHQSER